MDLNVLNVVLSLLSFLVPFVISFMLLRGKVKHAFLYSVLIAIILGSAICYAVVQLLFP